ncbi:hypothetical protein AGMMS49942_16300 [Spirochaetia bacterium]|nr:hypothetical protein AGMMS49942_16300 [Spirochaetia bacterium]
MTTTQVQPEAPMTYEQIREMFQETEQMLKENAQSQKETSLQIKETDRILQELGKETDRKMKETDRKISNLGSRLGNLIEHLTASDIVDKFNEAGYRFTRISRNHELKDTKNNILAEIDILLENGDFVLAVEVKTNLTKSGVKEHLNRMETLRRCADACGDKRKYVGSVAGALIAGGVREYALGQGLYVIEHPGQTIEIVAPPKTREW